MDIAIHPIRVIDSYALAPDQETDRRFDHSEVVDPTPIWTSLPASDIPVVWRDPHDGLLRYVVPLTSAGAVRRRAREISSLTPFARAILVSSERNAPTTALRAADLGRMLHLICRDEFGPVGHQTLGGFLRAARRAQTRTNDSAVRAATDKKRAAALHRWISLWPGDHPPLSLDTARHYVEFVEQLSDDAKAEICTRTAANDPISFCRALRCVVGVDHRFQCDMLRQTCPVRALRVPEQWKVRSV